MIEIDPDVPAGVDAVRAVGMVSRQDYETAVVPLLDAAEREGRGLRFLCEVDDGFRGLTPDGAWADLKLGLAAMRRLDGCAVVTDLAWAREATRLSAFFLPGHVRVFPRAERAGALDWLATLPGRPASVRVDREAGVVVVDVDQPLRREDLDAVEAAVDDWLAHHVELPGLVLHAAAFPGWENLGALVAHLRLVAGHLERVHRVALAVDGRLPALAARLAGTVLRPEVRHFATHELDQALTWAGQRQTVDA